MTFSRVPALALYLPLASWLIAAPVQANKGMTPVEFLNIPTVSAPTLSPDGKQTAFIKRESDWKRNRQVADIWLVNAKGKLQQLTHDKYTERDLAWSPVGNYMSFIAQKKGESHKNIHLIKKRGGRSTNITKDYDSDVLDYRWSYDGRSIYFLADEPLNQSDKKRKKAKDDMFPFEQPSTRRHIWKVNLRRRDITRITKGDFNVLQFALSPNNRWIAYNRAQHRNPDDIHAADIWVAPTDGGEATRVTDNDYAEYGIEFSPDNQHLLFISDVNAKGEYYYDGNLFIVAIDDKTVIPLALDQSFGVEEAHWANNGTHIYIRANMGVRSEIWVINILNDQAVQLTDGKHTVRNWSYNRRADRQVFTLRSATSPGEVWTMTGPGEDLQAVTEIYKDLNEQYRLPEQRVVRWQCEDGVTLEGLLTLPLDYEEGKRYPLVVQSHGGPVSSDQFGHFKWRTYIPVLAAMGYAYFTPNYRGGRGYGDAFLRDMVNGYFTHAHKDVMSGVDYLIEQGIADPDKLVKTGWSAGGHMTNKIITYTDRFKVASSGAGAVDWVSMYGETDMRYTRTNWFDGKPWQQDAPIDKYVEHSPLKDMWKVTTPTLIFAGEKDKRVPVTQSIIMYRALRDLGVTAELYVAPREKHSFKELRHRLFKINKELEWFEKYARGREYVWQQAPVE